MTYRYIYSLSYVPLIAPATSISRLPSLASIADSFIYVVSRMGVTGSSASASMSASLPELCARVRKYSGRTPIAVGFGVNTREHFLSVGNLAEGVVIGSKIVSLIKEAKPGTAIDTIRSYCREVSRPKSAHKQDALFHDTGLGESIDTVKTGAVSVPTATIEQPESEAIESVNELETLKKMKTNSNKEYEVSHL